MTDVEEAPAKLTISDIALMRQIIAWRKAEGIDFVKRKVYGAPYWVRYGGTGAGRQEVWHQPKGQHSLVMVTDWCPRSEGDDDYQSVDPASFKQAVDVLVAFGYLPARFSTAYRDGWSEGHFLGLTDSTCEGHPDVRPAREEP